MKKLAVLKFLNESIEVATITISAGPEGQATFNKIVNECSELERQNIIDAYIEGYEAAFHHEQSTPNTYLMDNFISGK